MKIRAGFCCAIIVAASTAQDRDQARIPQIRVSVGYLAESAKLKAEDIDKALEDVSQMFANTPCPVNVRRLSPIASLSIHNGSVNLRSQSPPTPDAERIARIPVNIKIVSAITECDKFSGGILGCTSVDKTTEERKRLGLGSITVMRDVRATLRKIQWAHELGHSFGLDDRSTPGNLMYWQAEENDTMLDKEQCATIMRNLRAHDAFRARTQGHVIAFQATGAAHATGGMSALKQLGQDTGLWSVTTVTAATSLPRLPSPLTPHDRSIALIFHSNGDSLASGQRTEVIDFVRDGGGLVAMHGALDGHWLEFSALVNGRLGSELPFSGDVRVLDRRFPATRHLGARFGFVGRIANIDGFDPTQARLLASTQSPQIPILWASRYGAGRVFSSNIGHDDSIFSRIDMQTMLLYEMSWALGYTDGNAGAPRPRFRFWRRLIPSGKRAPPAQSSRR